MAANNISISHGHLSARKREKKPRAERMMDERFIPSQPSETKEKWLGKLFLFPGLLFPFLLLLGPGMEKRPREDEKVVDII